MGQTGLPLFTLGHHRTDLKDSGHLTIRHHRMGRMRRRSLSSHDSSDLWRIGTLRHPTLEVSISAHYLRAC
jgi:hypothetical protein